MNDAGREVIISSNMTRVKKYHLPGEECNSKRRMHNTRRVTESTAKRAGLELCKTCDPDIKNRGGGKNVGRLSLRQILRQREAAE